MLVQDEENKVNQKRNLKLVRGFEDRSLFSQYDRYREIGAKAEESIKKMKDLAHEIDYATIKLKSLHTLKNKLAKLVYSHSKALGTLNGLKQAELFPILEKMLDEKE